MDRAPEEEVKRPPHVEVLAGREFDLTADEKGVDHLRYGHSISSERLVRHRILEILIPSADPRISDGWVRFTDVNKRNWYLSWVTRKVTARKPDDFLLVEESGDGDHILSYARSLFEKIESTCGEGNDGREYDLESIITTTTFLTLPGKTGGLSGGMCCGGSPLWIRKKSILDDREYHCSLLNDTVHWPDEELSQDDLPDLRVDDRRDLADKEESSSEFGRHTAPLHPEWEAFCAAFSRITRLCSELALRKQKEEECLTWLVSLTLSVVDLPYAISGDGSRKITRSLIEEFIERYDGLCKFLIRFSLAVKVSYEHYPPPDISQKLEYHLEEIMNSFSRFVFLANKNLLKLDTKVFETLNFAEPHEDTTKDYSAESASPSGSVQAFGGFSMPQTARFRMSRIGSIFVPSFSNRDIDDPLYKDMPRSFRNLTHPAEKSQRLEFPTPPSANLNHKKDYIVDKLPLSESQQSHPPPKQDDDKHGTHKHNKLAFQSPSPQPTDEIPTKIASYINLIISAMIDISSFYKVIHRRIIKLSGQDAREKDSPPGSSELSPSCVHNINESFQEYVVNILSILKKIILRSQNVLAENGASSKTILKFKACVLPLKAHYIDFSFMNNPSTHKNPAETCLQETIVTLLAAQHTLCLMLLSVKIIINDSDVAKNKVLTLWEREVYERCSESRDRLYSTLEDMKIMSEDTPGSTASLPEYGTHRNRNDNLTKRNYRSVYIQDLKSPIPNSGTASAINEVTETRTKDANIPSGAGPVIYTTQNRPASYIMRRNSINKAAWRKKKSLVITARGPIRKVIIPQTHNNPSLIDENDQTDSRGEEGEEEQSSTKSEREYSSSGVAVIQPPASFEIPEPSIVSEELARELDFVRDSKGRSKDKDPNDHYSPGFDISLRKALDITNRSVLAESSSREATADNSNGIGVKTEADCAEEDSAHHSDDGDKQRNEKQGGQSPKDGNSSLLMAQPYPHSTAAPTISSPRCPEDQVYISNQGGSSLVTPDPEELLSILRTQSEGPNTSADNNHNILRIYEPSILPELSDIPQNDGDVVTLKKVQKILGDEAPKKQKVTSSSHIFSPAKDRHELRFKSGTGLSNNGINSFSALQQGSRINPCAVCLHNSSGIILSPGTTRIEAASIDAMLEHLLMPVQMLCDISFERTVFLTYTTLMSTVEFVKRIIDAHLILVASRDRLVNIADSRITPSFIAELNIHQLKKLLSILNVLVIEDYLHISDDSVRLSVRRMMNSFLQSELDKEHDESTLSLIKAVLYRVNEKYSDEASIQRNKGKHKDEYLEIISLNSDAAALGAPQPAYKSIGFISFYNLHMMELARQLTIIETRNYCRLNHFLLLESALERLDYRAENALTSITRMFNLISSWVSLTILNAEGSKGRAMTIKRFINLCENCYYLNNYNTLVAILSSLSSSPIQRLKKAWRTIPWDVNLCLTELCDIMMPYKNFSLYRKTLEIKGNSPSVPFIGFYLTDLTFIRNGMPSLITHKHISRLKPLDRGTVPDGRGSPIKGEAVERSSGGRAYKFPIHPNDYVRYPPQQGAGGEGNPVREDSTTPKTAQPGARNDVPDYSNRNCLINITKLHKYSQVLKDVLKYQSFPSVFIPVPEIQLWLESTLKNSKADPSELYDLSLRVEP